MSLSRRRSTRLLRQDPFDRLPEDVLRRIFDFAIDRPADDATISRVAKRWNDFMAKISCWQYIELEFYIERLGESRPAWRGPLAWLQKRIKGIELLQLSPKRSPSGPHGREMSDTSSMWPAFLEVLQGSGVWDLRLSLDTLQTRVPKFFQSLGRMKQLVELTLEDVPESVKPADLRSLGRLTNLRDLALDIHWPEEATLPLELCTLTSLQRLEIQNLGEAASFSLPKGSAGCSRYLQNLKVLRLNSLRVTETELAGPTALIELDMYDTYISAPDVQRLPSTLQVLTLQSFSIESMSVCTSLRKLFLMTSGFILQGELEEFDRVLSCLRQLEHIYLECIPFDALPASIASLTTLQTLHVSNAGYSRKDYFQLSDGPYLTALEVLGLGPTNKIPAFLPTATNLRILDASEMPKFNESSARMAMKIPGLQKLHLPKPLEPLKREPRWVKLLEREAPQICLVWGGMEIW